MASQPHEQDLQQRLRDMEAELNRTMGTASSEGPSAKSSADSPRVNVEVSPEGSQSKEAFSIAAIASSIAVWFNDLGSTGKIIAGVAGAFALLTLFRITLTLVSTAISLLALGFIGYVAYRIWIAPKTDDVG